MPSREKIDEILGLLSKRGQNVPSGTIYDQQQKWISWYRGEVNTFHYYYTMAVNGTRNRTRRASLQMAKKVVEDWTSLLFNEKVNFMVNNDEANERLKQVLEDNNFRVEGSNLIELAYTLGTGALIEFESNDKTIIDYITGDLIIPISFRNSTIDGIVTINEIKKGDKFITHITYHELINGKYTVIHEVYVSDNPNSVGKPSSLLEIFTEEQVNSMQVINYNDSEYIGFVYDTDKPFFQIIKPNLTNNFDYNNPMGISVFANSIESLESVDIKYDAFKWEYEASKKRIMVDSGATKTQQVTELNGTDDYGQQFIRYFDSNDPLFMSVPMGEDAKDPIRFYDTNIRSEEFKTGLNQDLNMISFKCGLGTNYYQFNNDGSMTATEVISRNSDTHKNKVKHEIILEKAFKGMIYSILFIEKENGRLPKELDIDGLEINIEFDDSIIVDDEREYEKDLGLVNANLMPKKEFLMKWKGLTEEQASEWIQSIDDANFGFMRQITGEDDAE